MDGVLLLRLHGGHTVDRLAENVEHASKRLRSDTDFDGLIVRRYRSATLEAVGGTHRNRAHESLLQMLLHLKNQGLLVDVNREGREDRRNGHAVVELAIDHGSDDLSDCCWHKNEEEGEVDAKV